MLPSIYGFTRPELAAWTEAQGFSPVHAARLWRALYWECAGGWDKMEGVPAKVLDALRRDFAFGAPAQARETHSSDGFTQKYLLALDDSRVIETVLMRFTGRVTACLSTQAGCAMGCVFCATGQRGFERHLTAAEIVAQAAHVQRILRERREPAQRLRNVVLMGMGEPLHNYDAVMRAIDILRDPSGFSLGSERITLSTVGVVPGILRLAAERRPVHLAVSLHSADQKERAALVPAARKWPLDELMAACRTYSETTGRRIFYEWTLIEGRNDTAEHARALGRLLAPVGRHAQVNLIPLNPTSGFTGAPTRTAAADRFQEILSQEFHLPSTIRQRRGIDIAAGCGQLAATA